MDKLKGFVDIHIHTSPDIRDRKLDDISAAQSARDAGMTAIVIKSHITLTADRAAIAQKMVPDIKVFGSLVLNDYVGGINPLAAEAAVKLGAKIIWLPTVSAMNHKRFHKEEGGIYLLAEDGKVIPELIDILNIIAENDCVLATGHISTQEIFKIVPIAKGLGVNKIVITHPEVPWISMSIDEQRKILDYDVFFERCYVSTLDIGGGVPLGIITDAISDLGVGSTIISTDFGASVLDTPAVGFREYIGVLSRSGFSESDIIIMGIKNPSNILGIN